MKPLLLKHLSGESIGRFPVWAMRQAGRYLPEYRAVRAKHSFWEMVTRPELAAEVSLTPLAAKLPVDGVIFFSDILTLPYGLQVPIEMREGVGPVVTQPLRSVSDFEVFDRYRPAEHTPFVSEALTRIRETLAPELTLLGFAGAPWTVSCYLAEGKGGKKFEALRTWMHRDPADLALALNKLADATVAYLKSQVKAGAHVVQLFDTWLSEMPRAFFREHYLGVLNRILSALRQEKVPVIFFSKHAHHLLQDLAELETDVLSCDELLPLSEFARLTGNRFALQGNLDPLLLFGEEGVVRRKTRELVREARAVSKPVVLNLGHGLLPGTPVQNVRAFFEEAIQLWV